jgi:hypothetical protein
LPSIVSMGEDRTPVTVEYCHSKRPVVRETATIRLDSAPTYTKPLEATSGLPVCPAVLCVQIMLPVVMFTATRALFGTPVNRTPSEETTGCANVSPLLTKNVDQRTPYAVGPLAVV